MESIRLTFGTAFNPEVFSLSGDQGLYAQTATTIRGYASDYELTGHGISALTRPAREIQLEVKTHAEQGVRSLKRLMRAASTQLDAAPALVTIDRWMQHCQIPTIEVTEVTPRFSTATLTLALLDGWWMLEGETVSIVRTEQTDVALDHDYDHEYDLAGVASIKRIGADGNTLDAVDVLMRLRIFGPCANPTVQIGDNRFQVMTEVPADGYLTVDPLSRTVLVTASNGVETDVFPKAVRGEGLDRGEYIFQPLPPRALEVSYPGAFDFDVTPIYRRQHAW